MKKKSGHRRRTKVVRRSRKNLRRTVKRKSLGKGRRRPTRRYSRVQRGGGRLTLQELEALKAKASGSPGKAGSPNDQFKLGVMYYDGDGVTKDDAEAVRLYRLAAVQGHADAQVALGVMFANGQGVAKDDAEAVRLYRLAAAQGHAGAQFNLGRMFVKGQGVTKDDAEAVQLYRLAAAQGHHGAEIELRSMQHLHNPYTPPIKISNEYK